MATSTELKPFGSPTPFAEPLWYSRNLTPHYNESHRKLRAAIRAYVDDEILPYAFEWESAGEVPDWAFKRHTELGFHALHTKLDNVRLPGDIPLKDWDNWHTLIITDELARVGYTGVLWGLGGGSGIGVPPIVNFGTKEQKERFLPGVADAGSDVANIKTTAVRQGDYYIVNGSKKWITNGIWADYVTSAVRTGGPGAKGISVIVIPLKVEGVTTRKMFNSGVGASGSTFIEFDNVKVPVSNLLHKEGRGFEVIMSNFNPERKSMITSAIRLSRVCCEDAYRHASTRETFGKKLIENPIIRAKFLKMGRLIEPAFAFLEQLTWMMEESRKTGRTDIRIGGMTAMGKVMATRCLESCVREAQQVMGGLGYSKGGKGGRIEAISRDVRVMAVGGGSEEILSELALREEAKDLFLYHKTKL
ncbi:hypothetical protein V502_05211 [Pseudogymnoascus sp. VKM F-4520 (FW-2644)]|nr:hypothetical protein V502_05211 [Pseudogymnoascus sp. VKM F-4520 (FW-2644)]